MIFFMLFGLSMDHNQVLVIRSKNISVNLRFQNIKIKHYLLAKVLYLMNAVAARRTEQISLTRIRKHMLCEQAIQEAFAKA